MASYKSTIKSYASQILISKDIEETTRLQKLRQDEARLQQEDGVRCGPEDVRRNFAKRQRLD